jgi:outer membrane protein assembly factor BamB
MPMAGSSPKNDGMNYAIDAATGNSAWTWGDTLSVQRGVTQTNVANGIVIYGSHDGQVLAMDAATGGSKYR